MPVSDELLPNYYFCYFRSGSFTKGFKGIVCSLLNLAYDFYTSIIEWEPTNQLTLEDTVRKNAEATTKLRMLHNH